MREYIERRSAMGIAGAAGSELANPWADRIGFATSTRMAFDGGDLRPLRDEIVAKIANGTAGAGEGLDLSLITQLLGEKQGGVSHPAGGVGFHPMFFPPLL